MMYYTSDLKKVEYTPKIEPLGSGTQGSVYRLDENKCIKIYKEDSVTFDPEIFKFFKELSLKGYSKLHDLLYNDPDLRKVAGYIVDYYPTEVENILFMPLEYTLHNIDILYNSVKLLAENSILAKDTIPDNAILGKENITMIDFDTCRKSILSKSAILDVNTNNILYLFKRLYEEGLKKIGKDISNNEELSNYLESLFSYCKEPAKTLSKRMCGANKPYDLLYWRC